MIVRPDRGRLLLVRQTDHMALTGRLAEAWGNDRSARPEPFGPLIVAAAEHDAGWADWEAAPRVDPATWRPYQFTDLPVEEHLAFYQYGVNAVAAKDVHAGLLVNLHCQGLYNQRFGSAPEMTMSQHTPEQEAAIRRAIVALQAQERELGRHSANRAAGFVGTIRSSAKLRFAVVSVMYAAGAGTADRIVDATAGRRRRSDNRSVAIPAG